MKDNEVGIMDQYCQNCSLPAKFPGIHFNSAGICNFCVDYKRAKHQGNKRKEYQLKFESLIKEYAGKSTYDALMCYSGGKDSTYTLCMLSKQYKLRVLAVSFDNGFIPDQTLLNIRSVVENLGVDHIMVKPRFDVLARIFHESAEKEVYPSKALERSSAICTSCMGIIKYSALRLAIEKNIPFITYGWSPGQAPITSSIFKNNPPMIKMMQKTLYDRLYLIVGDAIRPYFLEEWHFTKSDYFPYNINPLAFSDYNIESIYANIEQFGWKKPKDTDANSTNCLLNSYANYVHKRKLGYHPYAFEMANLVREGYIERAEALNRLNQQEDPLIIKAVKEKINTKRN